ncbi:Na/Pi symporter, partial [archaeon]|nr:Na/Pi symporter [archaeon]
MWFILELLTGLALFVYGMHLMTTSLKLLSLNKIKYLLNKITSNRIKSFFVGIGITSIIQSSSATSVILIGFLNVGILTLTRAVPIIFGANIGTTITAQIIAFKLTQVAPFLIIFGLLFFF